MATRIPAGVGPRFPQVVVLFGATGGLRQIGKYPGGKSANWVEIVSF